MRKAINNNRTAQLVAMGVLALLGGFLLLKMTKGSGNEAGSSEPTTASPTGTAVPTVTGAPTTGAPTTAGLAATPDSSGGASAMEVPLSLIPGPGLPKSLLASYRDGDAIALFVVRAGGVDDARVRASSSALDGIPDLDVYVTKAKSIARYTWLTQGVNVTDLPALVVLRPRSLSGGTPTASVSYGFRDSESVVQAVKDELYRGPTDRPYHP